MGTPITHGTDNDQNIIVRVAYDKAGRMTALRDPRGNQTTYAYDALGRRSALTNPLDQTWTTDYQRLSDGRTRTTQTNPLTQQMVQETDKVGRVQTLQYPGESSPKPTPDVTFSYNKLGNRLKMTELDGATKVRETSYDYDAMRRLNSVAFDRDGDGDADETVTYAYDERGLRTKLTMPGDLDITYQYDAKGRLISLTDWDAQGTDYTYDAVNRLRNAASDNGLAHHYTYDAAGRLTELFHERYGKTLGYFSYAVDARGNRTQVFERVPHASSGNIMVNYDNPAIQYNGTWTASSPTSFMQTSTTSDSLGLVFFGDELEVTLEKNPAGGNFEIYVDGSLKLSASAYANPAQVQTYPLTGLGGWGHGLTLVNTGSGTTLKFQQIELIGDVLLFEDQTVQYTYDALARLKQATTYAGANTGATPRRAYSYTFDVAGNRTQESLTLNGGSPTVDTYTYDAANRISNMGFTYDDAGRLTNDGTNTYTWDRANRLLSMGTSDYEYNGLGQRIQQTVSATVTKYLLDQQPGLFQTIAATTGANTDRYVHGPMGLHAQKDAANNWEWMIQDGLGSLRGVVTGGANPLESRLYSPYGEAIGTTGTSQTPFGFTGEPTDGNGLVYLRARYYAPNLSAFTYLDPLEGDIQLPMSLNPYMYAYGNPISLLDPSGLAPSPGCGTKEGSGTRTSGCTGAISGDGGGGGGGTMGQPPVTTIDPFGGISDIQTGTINISFIGLTRTGLAIGLLAPNAAFALVLAKGAYDKIASLFSPTSAPNTSPQPKPEDLRRLAQKLAKVCLESEDDDKSGAKPIVLDLGPSGNYVEIAAILAFRPGYKVIAVDDDATAIGGLRNLFNQPNKSQGLAQSASRRTGVPFPSVINVDFEAIFGSYDDPNLLGGRKVDEVISLFPAPSRMADNGLAYAGALQHMKKGAKIYVVTEASHTFEDIFQSLSFAGVTFDAQWTRSPQVGGVEGFRIIKGENCMGIPLYSTHADVEGRRVFDMCGTKST